MSIHYVHVQCTCYYPYSLFQFAQPNPTFVLAELQGLNSFPRKTLSSLLDEVGLSGEWHLRMVDTMLRGVWSKFILNLFIRVKDYQVTMTPSTCVCVRNLLPYDFAGVSLHLRFVYTVSV